MDNDDAPNPNVGAGARRTKLKARMLRFGRSSASVCFGVEY